MGRSSEHVFRGEELLANITPTLPRAGTMLGRLQKDAERSMRCVRDLIAPALGPTNIFTFADNKVELMSAATQTSDRPRSLFRRRGNGAAERRVIDGAKVALLASG